MVGQVTSIAGGVVRFVRDMARPYFFYEADGPERVSPVPRLRDAGPADAGGDVFYCDRGGARGYRLVEAEEQARRPQPVGGVDADFRGVGRAEDGRYGFVLEEAVGDARDAETGGLHPDVVLVGASPVGFCAGRHPLTDGFFALVRGRGGNDPDVLPDDRRIEGGTEVVGDLFGKRVAGGFDVVGLLFEIVPEGAGVAGDDGGYADGGHEKSPGRNEGTGIVCGGGGAVDRQYRTVLQAKPQREPRALTKDYRCC